MENYRLLAHFMREFDFPALVLMFMLIGMALIVIKAQARADFDWAEALRDDNNKVSAFRLAILVSMAISSWFLVEITVDVIKTADDLQKTYYYYVTYLVVWSGAKIVEKALQFLVDKFAPPKTP